MKTRLLVLSIAVMCLSSAPAMASIVWFDIEQTEMTIDSTGHADVVFEAPTTLITPQVIASIQDTYGSQLDAALMAGTASNFDMDLNFVKVGSAWTATGAFWLQDASSGTPVKVAADLQSTSVTLLNGKLEITGPLSPSAPNTSILIPTSNTWTFTGDPLGVPGGLDTVADQITVGQLALSYNSGFAWVMQFAVPYNDLDSLFLAPSSGSPVVLHSGDIDLKVVPIPAAVLLGILGMGVAGLKLRKFA